MASDIDICNQALVFLGDSPIAAFTDANDRARVAGRFYASTRDSLLRLHPWNFAVVRTALALIVSAPDFGYLYQFALPTNPLCLRVISVNEDTPGDIPFVIEGRKLLTDESSIRIKYISQVTDPSSFDPLFIQALAARLSVSFAVALTKEKTLLEVAMKFYKDVLQEAKTINGMEGTRPSIVSNELINARYGGTRLYWETD